MTAAFLIAVLVSVVLARAYWVSCRKVDRRGEQIADREHELRQTAVQLGDLVHTLIEQDAELVLTRQACDAQEIKARHAQEQARGYRAEVMRLSADRSAHRDEMTAFTAWLGTLPTAEEQEYRRD